MSSPLRDVPRRGPIEAKPLGADDVGHGRTTPRSGPADPKQRVGNALRTPEPYVDLSAEHNLTGLYFERRGRYRLFVNHVGPHIECLITLVTVVNKYHVPASRVADDIRLPLDWGACNTAKKGGKHLPIAFRFAGDRVHGEVFRLYIPPWLGRFDLDLYLANQNVGSLEVKGDDRVELTLVEEFLARWPEHRSLEVSTAERASRAPVLLERYMAHAAVPWDVRTRVWFPMTPRQRRTIARAALGILMEKVDVDEHYRLSSAGSPADLRELLDVARKLPYDYQGNLTRATVATAIDALVKQVFDMPTSLSIVDGGFGTSHFDDLRIAILRILNETFLRSTDELPRERLFSLLQKLLDRVSSDAADVRALDKLLGLSSRGGFAHELDVQFTAYKLVDMHEVAGKLSNEAWKEIANVIEEASEKVKKLRVILKYMPITGLAGTLEISYTPPASTGPQEPGWTARYGIVLAGLQRSKGWGDKAEIKIRGKGMAFGSSPPRPEQLAGRAAYSRLDLGIGVRADDFFGLDLEFIGTKSVLMLYGDDSPGAGMQLVLDGELADISGGLQVGIEGIIGEVWLLDSKGGGDIAWMPEPSAALEFAKFWSKQIGETGVMFPINGARLSKPTEREEQEMTARGQIAVREALQAFAACELPLLANPMARIHLDGYADRSDVRGSNWELSENRAQSVANYLRSLLGNTLSGGRTAVEMSDAGRLVIAPHGEDDTPPESEHDVYWRKVELSVSLDPAATPTSDDAEATTFELRQHGISKPSR
ncbi:MAG: OmpA family protein [Deltaproteobacteria bacterium]|nr:OmpA family protein [Nannocystaceae bacterium]